MKRWLILLFLACGLSACVTGGRRGQEVPMRVYDLGAPFLAAEARPGLALEVKAPVWLDSMAIDYRLLYQGAGELRQYGRARWVAPPSQLLQAVLAQGLGVQAVGQVRTSCLLRLELEEFAQHFSTPATSAGQLAVRASLLGGQRQVLAQQSFRQSLVAPTADAEGGVLALRAAVRALNADLAGWLRSTAGSCGPQG